MSRKKSSQSATKTLTEYIDGVSQIVNIYEFIDRVHNILYGKDAAGGIDATKRILPVIGYIINKAREKGGRRENVIEVIDELLSDIIRAKTGKLKPFIGVELMKRVDDAAIKDFLREIERTIDSLGVTTLEKILKTIKKGQEIQEAILRYDTLGALFEKMVYEAFKGGAGKYLTHRNLVLTMREIAWAQFESEGVDPINVKVYDPCAGSARFLTFWLEKVIKSRSDIDVREYSEKHLFATDKFEEMVGIAAINMMIAGNGVANIYRADATDHFGPIVDLYNTVELLRGFKDLWDELRGRIKKSLKPETIEKLEEIEEYVYKFAEYIINNLEKRIIELDVSSKEFLAFSNFVYMLRDNDIALDRLPGLRELAKIAELPSINYLMKEKWSKRNKEIRKGFDLVLTNPPMGRAGKGRGKDELLVKEPHILAQYMLAQNKWIYSMSRKELRELAKKLGISADPDKVAEELGRDWVTPEDYGNYSYKIILRDPELGWEYTIFYDTDLRPIILRDKLPIQVILLEQFLRVVRLEGKVFTVIDVGVLNNPGDEWIRRLLFLAKHIPVKAKLKAVIELPHGAFIYTGAGTKTALLFYERVTEISEDYEFFVALAECIGYDTHSKSAEPIRENDLPLIIAEYLNWIGRKPEFYEECKREWSEKRMCSWWIREFEVVK